MPREKLATRQPPRKSRLGYDAAVVWILHRSQPINIEKLIEELKLLIKKSRFQKTIQYDIVPFLIERGIVKKLSRDGKVWYALSDYEYDCATILWAMEDFELLHHRWPTVSEIALKAGIPEEKVRSIAYQLAPKTGWEPPSDSEIVTSASKARSRLELAAWMEKGCREASYLKQWPENELEKADRILKMRPEYVPKIEAYRYVGDDKKRFYCRLIWPKIADDLVGTDRAKSRMVYVKYFKGHLRRLKIRRVTEETNFQRLRA